jgi:hypothetical protein
MAATRGTGVTIAQGATNIGVLTEVESPEKSQDSIETTTLDTSNFYKTFIGGLLEGGEVNVKGYFDVSDTGQLALNTALEARTVDSYTLTHPTATGTSITFSALVLKFKIGPCNLNDAITFESTLKISGKPTLNTTASTGMSALTFVQTDGSTALTAAALTPTFAIGTFFYGFTFTTQTAFKVKPTAASHTISVYVDGVFSETISSGSAGSSISIGAAATKQITVIVQEAGKTPKTYNFAVQRLS